MMPVASVSTCAHCGKGGAKLQLCSTCKAVAYCSKDCQIASWKSHKKACVKPGHIQFPGQAPLDMKKVREKVALAHREREMKKILQFAPAEDLLVAAKCFDTEERSKILGEFADAHMWNRDWASAASCYKRQAVLLGALHRFKDQGESICYTAVTLRALGDEEGARQCNERARKIGEQHGFFQLECDPETRNPEP